jgi:hypothetical protein
MEGGTVKPTIARIFPFEDIAEAHRFLGAKQIGKVVVTLNRFTHTGVHEMSNQPLFTAYRMGDLDLPNRIVMAPLTRMRAPRLDRRGLEGGHVTLLCDAQ